MGPRAFKIKLAVIRQAQAGHAESLSQLTRQVTDAVFVYIYRLTLDRNLAEDLTQDTMLSVLKRLKGLTLKSSSAFWAWTYRTALSKVQHHYRAQGRRRITPFSEMHPEFSASQKTPRRRGALEQLMRKEKITAIFNALDALKLEHRHVLVLRCLDEMSYAQIATVLGGTELRARLLFLRAKRSLHRQLSTQDFDRKHLRAILGVFGYVTLSSRKTVQAMAGPVTAETVQAGAVASALFTLTTVPGIIALTVMATAFITTSSKLANTPAVQESTPAALAGLTETRILSPFLWGRQPTPQVPGRPVRLMKPEDQTWYAYDPVNPEAPYIPTDPQGFFAQKQASLLALLFPQAHAADFIFAKPLRDIAGPDLMVLCVPAAKLPSFYIVGKDNQTVPITPLSYQNSRRGFVYLAFDMASLSLGFRPTAFRIVGSESIEASPCFAVTQVRLSLDPKR